MRVRAEFGDSSLDISLVFLAFLQFRLNHFDIMLDLSESQETNHSQIAGIGFIVEEMNALEFLSLVLVQIVFYIRDTIFCQMNIVIEHPRE